MKPKEKAIELRDKFYKELQVLSEGYSGKYSEVSKKCALILVQEIYEIDLIPGRHEGEKNPENYYSFWEDVKNELEKL